MLHAACCRLIIAPLTTVARVACYTLHAAWCMLHIAWSTPGVFPECSPPRRHPHRATPQHSMPQHAGPPAARLVHHTISCHPTPCRAALWYVMPRCVARDGRCARACQAEPSFRFTLRCFPMLLLRYASFVSRRPARPLHVALRMLHAARCMLSALEQAAMPEPSQERFLCGPAPSHRQPPRSEGVTTACSRLRAVPTLPDSGCRRRLRRARASGRVRGLHPYRCVQ